MGGNVTATIHNTGVTTRAQKVQLQLIGRQDFIKIFVEIFKTMNAQFTKKYNQSIWADENILTNGFVFNGSTSFILNPDYTDEEILKHKTSCGDIDITVPDHLKADLWEYLYSIEGKEIIPGTTYMGSNKPSITSIGEQINSVFFVEFPNGETVNVQVDFEFLEFENDLPTEWAKFSHSSSFVDAKTGVKAVHHKYLIRALVGVASVRDDIIIATPKSTADNIKLTTSKIHTVPRMLKFSVSRGIRIAYEPILDEDGNYIEINGKKVFREIPSKTSTYTTDLKGIFKLTFGSTPSESDLEKFNSFVGVCELMKEKLTKLQIDETHNRYLDLLWAPDGRLRAQELESGNPELDKAVKVAGWNYFTKHLDTPDTSKIIRVLYYSTYNTKQR